MIKPTGLHQGMLVKDGTNNGLVTELEPQTSVNLWLYWSLLPIHRFLISLYFSQIVIQGADHLPTQGPLVLAPKHYSRWDPLVLMLLSLEPLWSMTNANQFSGIQGWFIQRLGAFPVDLNRPKISSFRYAIDRLLAGKKLMMFPEGGIVRDQPLRDLKPGLARLVLQAEAAAPEPMTVPIVPIAIRYFPAPRPRAKIMIDIAPPICSGDYQRTTDKQTAEAMTQALQARLLEGLERLGAKGE